MLKYGEEVTPICPEQSGNHSENGSVDLSLEDGEPLPLYHVDGELNITDLISAQDVSEGSLWQKGPEWLTEPISQMPLKKYDQIFLKKDNQEEALKECHSEPFMTSGEVNTLPPSKVLLNSSPLQPSRPSRLVLTFPLIWFAMAGPGGEL